MVDQYDGDAAMSQTDKPGVNRLPVLFPAFADATKEAGDIVENHHPNVGVGVQNFLNRHACWRAGQDQVDAQFFVDQLASEKMQSLGDGVPCQGYGTLAEFDERHLA